MSGLTFESTALCIRATVVVICRKCVGEVVINFVPIIRIHLAEFCAQYLRYVTHEFCMKYVFLVSRVRACMS